MCPISWWIVCRSDCVIFAHILILKYFECVWTVYVAERSHKQDLGMTMKEGFAVNNTKYSRFQKIYFILCTLWAISIERLNILRKD